MFFSLEELVKPLEDYSRWNMEMDLFISQNQKNNFIQYSTVKMDQSHSNPRDLLERNPQSVWGSLFSKMLRKIERYRIRKSIFIFQTWVTWRKSMWMIRRDDLESMWIIWIWSCESEDSGCSVWSWLDAEMLNVCDAWLYLVERWRASGEVETDTPLCAFVASSTCPQFFSSEWREKTMRKRQGLFQLSSQKQEMKSL